MNDAAPPSVFAQLDAHDFERVVFCRDAGSGLRAIIAIHDTTLGPALGGVRMYPYESEADALTDVLRLARGMTYKASISGVSLGGGKSVIMGDPQPQKSPELLAAMARFIDAQGGSYIAGQDIGTNPLDMAVIRGVTQHVSCVDESAGGMGDASAATAFGVVCGIRAVLEAATGSDDLAGRHIAIQGLGNVGYRVAKRCREAGATITATDVVEDSVRRAVERLDAAAVAPDEIYDVECDVFSPNSVGAVINDDTLPRLRCAAVAGGANNVLAEPRHAVALRERGIVYGPDYLVNSGGLIQCEAEVLGPPTTPDIFFDKVGQIYQQTRDVLTAARDLGIDSATAADRIAEERIATARRAGRAWNPLRNASSGASSGAASNTTS